MDFFARRCETRCFFFPGQISRFPFPSSSSKIRLKRCHFTRTPAETHKYGRCFLYSFVNVASSFAERAIGCIARAVSVPDHGVIELSQEHRWLVGSESIPREESTDSARLTDTSHRLIAHMRRLDEPSVEARAVRDLPSPELARERRGARASCNLEREEESTRTS